MNTCFGAQILALYMLLCTCLLVISRAEKKGPGAPHIVFFLLDDLGWNGVGYKNEILKTPKIDELANQGIKLESHYTYRFCAPSRASLLTGRLGYRLDSSYTNYLPITMKAGTDLSYQMLPRVLQKAGYKTYLFGKWHQGFYKKDFYPTRRGFDVFFGFLSGAQDHLDQTVYACKRQVLDLYYNEDPVTKEMRDKYDEYSDLMYTQFAVEMIAQHNVDTPGFFLLSLSNTHGPIQSPASYSSKYSGSIGGDLEKQFNGMISVIDESVESVVNALTQKNMYSNTLIVWVSDNGANLEDGGSNHPLRGGKASNWEGGIRTPAFVSGGFIPPEASGQTRHGLFSIADWYATLAYVAAVTPSSKGPSPSDSVNQWLYLTSGDNSPRDWIVHDHMIHPGTGFKDASPEIPLGALRVGNYKIIVGRESRAAWYGEFYPNSTSVVSEDKTERLAPFQQCGTDENNPPCLFDIENDPTEHVPLQDKPEFKNVLKDMMTRWSSLKDEYHPPYDAELAAESDEKACEAFMNAGGATTVWESAPTALLQMKPAKGHFRGVTEEPHEKHARQRGAPLRAKRMLKLVAKGAKAHLQQDNFEE